MAVLLISAPPTKADAERTGQTNQLFGPDRVIPIRIQIELAEKRRLIKQPGEYVSITVRVDDKTFTNAQARLKGHGGFQPITEKPNFCSKVDKPSTGERPFSNKRLLLNNPAQDPSLIRWKLSRNGSVMTIG